MKFLTETHLQEFSSDKFKYKELSKKILEEILLKMELPNCFGLYGHWGSGKSTLIRFIIQHINSEYDDVLPVYFEPWKYEYSNHNELLFALLHKIRKDLSMKSSAKWKKLFAGLLAIGTGSLKAANVVDMDIQKISSDAKELEEKFCNQHERWVNEVEEFRDSFQSIINDGLKKKRSDKIIIFIDDLDRCLPENTVRILEAIKNFLNVENTLFVLAIDSRVVSEMIEKKYGLHRGYGDEYLTKIIHYNYVLPKNTHIELVKDLLNSYKIVFTPRQVGYIDDFLLDFDVQPRITKHLIHQLCMNIALSSKAAELLQSDNEEQQLQYLFVASYLLVKFPRLFTSGNVQEHLNNIRESTVQLITPDKNSNHDEICGRDKLIDSGDRKPLESIFKHPIFPISQTGVPSRGIINKDKLNDSLLAIRNQ